MTRLPAFFSRPMTRTWLAALAVTASACSTAEDAGPAGGIFVADADAVLIAVVAADDLVTVLASDGNYDYLGIHEWFHGQLDDGAGTLTNAGGATLDLTITGDQFSAALRGERVTNGPYDFTGAAVASAQAGLYWGTVDGWVGGWIVDDAGEQRGAALNHSTDDGYLPYIDPTATSAGYGASADASAASRASLRNSASPAAAIGVVKKACPTRKPA
jgi:hypothetical protein